MIEIRPLVQATGPDNPAKQISVTNWNLGHALTAAPNSVIGTNGTGAAVELPISGFVVSGDLSAYATDAELAAGLATKAPLVHTHIIADVTGLQSALDAKADDTDLAGYSPIGHTHGVFTSGSAGFAPASGGGSVNFLRADGTWQPAGGSAAISDGAYPTSWDGDTATAPSRNAVYDKLALIDTAVAGKAPLVHTHVIADTTGLQAALDAKVDDSEMAAMATDAELAAGLATKANTVHTHAITDVTGLTAALAGKADDADLASYIPLAEKGMAGGVAPLDGGSKVPAAYLPSYVDDVVEYANLAAFPVTGETGKIYIALDTNKQYRWSGATYVELSSAAGAAVWGAITGTLSAQTDLQSALNAKANLSGGNSFSGDQSVTGTVIASTGFKATNGVFYRGDGTPIVAAPAASSIFFHSETNGSYEFLNSSNLARVTFNCDTGAYAFTGNVSVTNEAYGSSWNGSTNVPTKDAVYDKIEALAATGYLPLGGGTLTGDLIISEITPSLVLRDTSAGLDNDGKISWQSSDLSENGYIQGGVGGDLTMKAIGGDLLFDTDAGTILKLDNGGEATFPSARVTFDAPALDHASIRLPHGTAPTTLANGDMWTTTAGFFGYVNGATIGPFGSGGGGGGLTDGDKGDVVVGGSGTTLTVESATPADGSFDVAGGITATGDLTISKVNPVINLKSDAGNPYPTLQWSEGATVNGYINGFAGLYYATIGQHQFYVGGVHIGNINSAGLTVNGNQIITGPGTGSTFDGILKVNQGNAPNTYAAHFANLANLGVTFSYNAGGALDVGTHSNAGIFYATTNRTQIFYVNNRAYDAGSLQAFLFQRGSGANLDVIRIKDMDAGSTGDFLRCVNDTDVTKARIKSTGAIEVLDDAYAVGWNGSVEVPTKNAVYDKIEAVVASIPAAPSTVISDAVYAAGWNGVTTIAPSKNAVYDQIELTYLKTGGTLTGNVSISLASPALTLNPVSGNSVIDLRGTASTNDGIRIATTAAAAGRVQCDTFTITNRAAGATYAVFSSTGLAVTGTLSATGAVSGSNLSGTNTGDQTTITGNAGTATALATSRNFSISGSGITAAAVGFDGTAPVVLNASVDAGHVTLARMANLAANSIIGNNTGSGAVPLALTGAQVTAMLAVATTSAQGVVVPPGGTSTFLRADATWAAPPGGGTLADGDYGDVNVTASGTAMTVQSAAGTFAAGGRVQFTGNGTFTAGALYKAATEGIAIVGATGSTSDFQFYTPAGASVFYNPTGTQNVVFDGTVSVPDNAYAAGWNGSLEVPTRNAVYDKIEAVIATIPAAGVSTFNTRSGAVTLTTADVTTAMPAFTGDVTSVAGATANTIPAGTVTLAKMANLAANSFIGNNTGSSAVPLALSVANAKTLLAITTGDVAAAAGFVVSCRAVTGAGAYSEVALAANTLLGRGATGNIVGCTLGATLSFSAAVLSVASTPAAHTFNNSGTGDASGTSFNGSVARTTSYNTIGAAPLRATITAKTGTYTLLDTDAGNALTMNGTTLTLNLANLTAGTMVVVRNIHASSPVTVALNSCTLYKNGATASAAGSLAAGGVITLMCWGSSVWTATGSGLT